ncbi:MAG: phosphopantetheine adenylyltransferase [Promethearchaeota archaeon]
MSQKEYSLVGLGGTFDRLHKGHEALIQKAFEIGVQVLIGITSDEMLVGKDKFTEIQPYAQRVENIKNYLKSDDLLKRSKIIKLEDPYGPAVTRKEMEAIIVTEETRPTAEEINKIRKSNRLVPLAIISVPRVLAEDGIPISSSRIRAGMINKNGKMLKET